jgi:hypothetical protein
LGGGLMGGRGGWWVVVVVALRGAGRSGTWLLGWLWDYSDAVEYRHIR